MKIVALEKRGLFVEVKKYLEDNILVFDGAMGTMLQKKGLKLGENPELFNIKEKDKVREIHEEYLNSGAMVITTNTFGANELKLEETGYSVEEIVDAAVSIAKEARGNSEAYIALDVGPIGQTFGANELKLEETGYSVEEIVDAAVSIAKEARGNSEAYIALDVGPIGQLLEPMGTLSFDEAYEIFKRQVVQGEKSGADIILIETMTDLYEAKAALLASKENTSLPVFCTMSFEENGRTFTGCTPESMVMVLEGLGADAIGINCSLGPKELLPIVKRIKKWTNLPIMTQPNAGLPTISRA